MKPIKHWLRAKFIHVLIHGLFKAIDARDVFRLEGPSTAYFNDKQIPADTLDRLQTDALRYQNSLLWQVLSRELRYKACELIAYSSKTAEDMIAGKMLLYMVKVQEDILDELKKS